MIDGRMLAPIPDFRYVGLAPSHVRRAFVPAGLVAGLTFGAVVIVSPHAWPLATGLAALAGLGARVLSRRAAPASHGPDVAIVPWGVIVEPDDLTRVLRWAAVREVRVETRHARDAGSTQTLSSLVTVETDRERWVGITPGGSPLDLLVAHLDAYAAEQARPIALDLEGGREGPGPVEPEVELLLRSAQEILDSASGASALDLPPGGYRSIAARAPSERAVEILRAVLVDREPKARDPRALAAVLAAMIHATPLVGELLDLVQCPHPLVAAVAKQAARRLGAPTKWTGTLEEVVPFLRGEDAEALRAWFPEAPALAPA
jgi:hypothetical protein